MQPGFPLLLYRVRSGREKHSLRAWIPSCPLGFLEKSKPEEKDEAASQKDVSLAKGERAERGAGANSWLLALLFPPDRGLSHPAPQHAAPPPAGWEQNAHERTGADVEGRMQHSGVKVHLGKLSARLNLSTQTAQPGAGRAARRCEQRSALGALTSTFLAWQPGQNGKRKGLIRAQRASDKATIRAP